MKNIIIETGLGKGAEEYGNMGDVSMLQVAVDRLHRLFPNARLEVLTDSAENLLRFCPQTVPLENRGRALWFSNRVLPGGYCGLAPKWTVNLLAGLKGTIRSFYPNLLRTILVKILKQRNRMEDAESVASFTHSLEKADLVLICGAGGFYDGCHAWNMDILDLMEAAIQRKTPVAMLGQGFGPLSNPIVLRRAAKILPRVNLITLRGGRGSLDLLRSLGVPESKVQITGDDALELAYGSRSGECGLALGINIRFLSSAQMDANDFESIGPVLHEFARRHNVLLIPLPIAMHLGTRDDLAIKRLLIGFDEQSDGGEGLDSPLKVIRQAALCRVVVTGAYHAAVFALAQGIPVVALAKSDYFSKKLLGLTDQYGECCQTLLLSEPDLPRRLRVAVEKAWENSETMRKPQQTTVLRQIELSRRSYEMIQGLAGGVENRVFDSRNATIEPVVDAEPRIIQ